MATKIKLMRLGKMRAPYYRIVVADSRTKRSGRVIETIGKYHPKENPSFIEVNSDRAQYWLGVGAQPTEPVAAIFRVTGDWQKFKGLPAPEPMQTRAERADKKAVFEAAAKETVAAEDKPPKKAAARPRKTAEKTAEKAAKTAEEVPPAETEAAAEPAAEPAAEEPAPAEPAAATETEAAGDGGQPEE